jgi:hypothetical protein
MYNVGYYVQSINGRSRPVHFGVYQKQTGLNYTPTHPTPPKPEAIPVSPKYKNQAEQFTQAVLRVLKIGAAEQPIIKEVEQLSKQPLNILI